MPEAVIVAAARTPIGRAAKGSLADVRPDDLLAFAIREAVGQVPELDPNEIVDVMVGCGFPQEKQGMNLARRAALLAGLPKRVPGHDSEPLLRLLAPDGPHGLPRDQGRRGGRLRRGRRRVDLAGRRLSEGHGGAAPEADRRGRDRERLHPDGDDRGERRRAVRRLARGHGPLRAALAGARRRGTGVGFFARELTPYTKEDGTVVVGRRRAAARARRSRSCGAAARRSSRTARSRRATRAR